MKDFNIKSSAFTFLAVFSGSMAAAFCVCFALGLIDANIFGKFLSILGLSLFPFLQLLWFGPNVIKRASYGLRTAGFGLSYLAVLSASALVGDWMGDRGMEAWIWFLVMYLLILAVISIAINIHYKRTAGSYQKALEQYREAQKSDIKGNA